MATTFIAAFVTGGLGYGFSSITVPIGLLFYTNKILNPSLVLIEVGANLYVLFTNRGSLSLVWKRLVMIVVGLIPGIVIGSYLLNSIDPWPIKFATYAILSPLIILQSFGLKKPFHAERAFGICFGSALGVLYSLTTISGPPLALALNNEGYKKHEFKAAVGIIRSIESIATALAYGFLGVFTMQSFEVLAWILPGVAVGMPLGAFVLNRLDQLYFRRICISIDVWLIAFGFGRALWAIDGLHKGFISAIFLAMVVTDGLNFRRFSKEYEKNKGVDLFDQQQRAIRSQRAS